MRYDLSFFLLRPVPSGTLPAFYRPPWTPGCPIGIPQLSACLRFWFLFLFHPGATDSRCLLRQRDRNLFIALADRHSRPLIGGTNQLQRLWRRIDGGSERTHAKSMV